MARILVGRLGRFIPKSLKPFVRVATEQDFIEVCKSFSEEGWKFHEEYAKSLLNSGEQIYRLPFDPSGGDCLPLVSVGNWVAVIADKEPNLSGIVASGETLDDVMELLEDFEEPVETL